LSYNRKTERQLSYERFGWLMDKVVGRLPAEDFVGMLGTPEATIRSWCGAGRSVPHTRTLHAVLARLKVPEGVFYGPEEEWKKFCSGFQPTIVADTPVAGTVGPRKKVATTYPWLFTTTEILAILSTMRDRTLIFFGTEPEDHFARRDVRQTILDCAKDGIIIVYVIPENCPHKDELIRFCEWDIKLSGGKAYVAVDRDLDHADRFWMNFEYAIIITESEYNAYDLTDDSFTSDDIERAFVQLYTPNDFLPPDHTPATTAGRLWTAMPYRRLPYFAKFLNYCCVSAEWHPKEPPDLVG
jgi:hypothetical protein